MLSKRTFVICLSVIALTACEANSDLGVTSSTTEFNTKSSPALFGNSVFESTMR